MKESNLALDLTEKIAVPATRTHERPSLHVVACAVTHGRKATRRRPFRLNLSNNGHRPFRTF